jgi:hypothetical protein
MIDPRRLPNYGFGGLPQLRDPQALLRKLKHDLARISAAPDDPYPVFDFFVTANHLIDWVWPTAGKEQHRKERAASAVTRICEHLGNGVKHFVLNAPHQTRTIRGEGTGYCKYDHGGRIG